MPISQTEGYFENPYDRFLEEPMLFLLALKWKLKEKAFSNVKTKNQLKFCRKSYWKKQAFIFTVYLMNTFFRHLYDNGIKRT